MRDAFDRNCALGQPESPRLPIALIACAALLAFLILGAPTSPEPAPSLPSAEAPVAANPS